jgi:hypothetical protein
MREHDGVLCLCRTDGIICLSNVAVAGLLGDLRSRLLFLRSGASMRRPPPAPERGSHLQGPRPIQWDRGGLAQTVANTI